MEDYFKNLAHRRFNILTEEWVLVSPHRTKRPWQGQEEEIPKVDRPSYDKSCYLCPGNKRANGEQNPNYEDVFIFENDFAALTQNNEAYETNNGLIKAETESGICKVICFSPDHSKSLAQMSIDEIKKVVLAWQSEYFKLGREEAINYVQIFENKGEVMGCSNPHPHGQIWSQSSLPNEVDKKDKSQRRYHSKNNRSMLADYLKQELEINERIIFENKSYAVLVPFWAIWPFEVMILPKSHQNSIYQIPPSETILFAEAISVITRAYDKLFNCSFPYSSGIHQAPTNSANNKHWHWHMNFYPPLLRSATVKKFMVGYEMFASPQRDITAESAAKTLQSLIQINF
ncbi:UDP-glucose--hexose-1-phosphate uridylyltransferase [Psychroserpens algicola]|uniref:Galactose-1-phosphate uridylyltransferase n=1 Tax=Psychroserpens algicola TaxID=1719034 RepID=A0ABT0H613_9FLAO|nr:UDP-glucose--hexose-1-phosphate uridylyltransferase [Psychroserpens algicola]MCK8479819.1 UDP-glucose--hexose-1-phosphate uridylyltransferase [Psychroserpens algicola]